MLTFSLTRPSASLTHPPTNPTTTIMTSTLMIAPTTPTSPARTLMKPPSSPPVSPLASPLTSTFFTGEGSQVLAKLSLSQYMTADVETGDVEHMTAVEVCLSATQQQQFLSMLRKLADDPDHKHLWVEMSEFLGVHYPCGVDGRSPVLSVASLINAICSREFDEVFDDIEGGPAKGEEPSQALDGEQADEGAER